MPTTKRTKYSRYRGSHTHGGGSKKKRRGAGNRGGRGLAGSGKRAHHHKQRVFKIFGKNYFGKKGFHSKIKKDISGINIEYIEEHIEDLIESKFATQKSDTIELNLEKLGFSKLLSSGIPTKKYKIQVKSFSKKAKEKIEASGGEVVNS